MFLFFSLNHKGVCLISTIIWQHAQYHSSLFVVVVVVFVVVINVFVFIETQSLTTKKSSVRFGRFGDLLTLLNYLVVGCCAGSKKYSFFQLIIYSRMEKQFFCFFKFLLFHQFQRQRDKQRQINKFWTNKQYFGGRRGRGGALRKTKKTILLKEM